MKNYRRFAYAQARLQARQSGLPDDVLWRRLDATQSAAPFLQAARASAMRSWVASLSAHQEVHEIEALLRAHWRRYIDEVAHFTPKPWQQAVHWFSLLPELAVITHLRAALPAPSWIRNDPLLRPLAAETPGRRARIWQDPPFVYLSSGTKEPMALWITHWRDLWPSGSDGDWSHFLLRTIWLADPATGGKTRARKEASLRNAFHRYAFTPGALFIHLLLVLFSLERLRGALARRLLFPRDEGVTE